MPMAQALRLCPHAIVQKGRYGRYREISDHVFSIFERFTPVVQSVGIDEAFLDVTGSFRLFGDGESIARQIRATIKDETGLTASVGVAPNKFLAKLGSDLNKPDGLTLITPDNLDAIICPLSISRIWGIGGKTARKLESLNIKTVGDLRAMDEPFFDRFFGEWGARVHQLIHGIDDREVMSDHEAKSIGQEQTFHDNIHDPDTLRGILLEQVEEVGARLRRKGRCSGGISLKIRYGDFRTITRSRKLDSPTNVTQILWEAAKGLFDEWARADLAPLRLLGMQCTSLTDSGQMPLFGQRRLEKQQRLDATLDRINQRFASTPVHRAKLT
jgi:DNA polymerase-4